MKEQLCDICGSKMAEHATDGLPSRTNPVYVGITSSKTSTEPESGRNFTFYDVCDSCAVKIRNHSNDEYARAFAAFINGEKK